MKLHPLLTYAGYMYLRSYMFDILIELVFHMPTSDRQNITHHTYIVRHVPQEKKSYYCFRAYNVLDFENQSNQLKWLLLKILHTTTKRYSMQNRNFWHSTDSMYKLYFHKMEPLNWLIL